MVADREREEGGKVIVSALELDERNRGTWIGTIVHTCAAVQVKIKSRSNQTHYFDFDWLIPLSPLQMYSFLYPVKPSGQLKLTLTGLAII